MPTKGWWTICSTELEATCSENQMTHCQSRQGRNFSVCDQNRMGSTREHQTAPIEPWHPSETARSTTSGPTRARFAQDASRVCTFPSCCLSQPQPGRAFSRCLWSTRIEPWFVGLSRSETRHHESNKSLHLPARIQFPFALLLLQDECRPINLTFVGPPLIAQPNDVCLRSGIDAHMLQNACC